MEEENRDSVHYGEATLSPIQKYLEDQRRVDETIHFLRHLGGTCMEFNPYKDTIIRLEGVFSGMRMADNANDL